MKIHLHTNKLIPRSSHALDRSQLMDGVMTDAYGQRLGEQMRAESAPAIVTRALRTADIAVTELRCDNPTPEMSGSLQQDAFVVALHLRDRPNREYWEDGRPASVCDVRAGESCLHDLKRDPSILLNQPYHVLSFYLPRAALDAIAEGANAPLIHDLSYKPGVGVNDVTISSLGNLLLPALSHTSEPVVSRLHPAGVRGACRSDLWRHAPSVAAGPGWARALAGATCEGDDRRQSRWCAGQGAGAGMRVINVPFFARVSSFCRSGAAQLAN